MPFRPIGGTDNFRPIATDNFRPVSEPANDMERGFFGKIGESFERGQEGWHTDLAVYEALGEGGDIEGALRARQMWAQENALDPITDNAVTELIYKSARTAGQMWETLKRGGWGAVVGGGIGAAGGAAVGALAGGAGAAPGAAVGAQLGAKLGSAEAAAVFSYRVGVGGMYADMREQGVSHENALKAAQIGGIPYALIEAMQLKAASPAVKKTVQEIAQEATKRATKEVLKKAGKTYAKTIATEVGEEIGQEIVQIATEDMAKKMDGMGVPIDKRYFKDRVDRLLEVGIEATKSMALLPAPRVGVEAAIQLEAGKVNSEVQQMREDARATEEVTVEDITDPVTAVRAAVRQSTRATEGVTKVREKELRQRTAAASEAAVGADWRRNAMRELKGKMAEANVEPLVDKIPVEVYHQLDQQIRDTDKLQILSKVNLSEALEGLFKEGRRLRPYEIKLAREMWGDGLAQDLEEMGEGIDKTQRVYDWFNLPRATAASLDLSRSFRQNALLMGNPKIFARSIARDYGFLLSDEKAARLFEHDQFVAYGDLIQKMDLRWNDWGTGAGWATGTEYFASRVASKIPGVKRSERAFALGGNMARLEMAKMMQEQYADKGLSDKQWQDIGKVINILTGEGSAKSFKKFAPALNAVFFAPRLLEARVRSVTELVNPNLGWAARKLLATNMAKFVAINMSVLASMAAVPGVDVERDPRSTDFGKIKIGNTRVDFWGGYLPLARTLIRLGTGERKTQSGRIVDADAYDTIMSFLQAKLGPVSGAVLDNLRGTDFIGEDVSLDADGMMKQFWSRFTPFFIQDVIEAMRVEGWPGLATAPLAFHGAGVTTYESSPGAQVMMLKNEISGKVLGRRWDELGPEVQNMLTESYPAIEQAELDAAEQQNNFGFMEVIAEQRATSEKELMNALPADVQKKLQAVQASTGGISRSIANGWFLNEKRYQQYQDMTALMLKKMLTPLVRSDKWDKIPVEMRRSFVDELATKIKNSVRQEIVSRANANDLERVGELYGR